MTKLIPSHPKRDYDDRWDRVYWPDGKVVFSNDFLNPKLFFDVVWVEKEVSDFRDVTQHG